MSHKRDFHWTGTYCHSHMTCNGVSTDLPRNIPIKGSKRRDLIKLDRIGGCLLIQKQIKIICYFW